MIKSQQMMAGANTPSASGRDTNTSHSRSTSGLTQHQQQSDFSASAAAAISSTRTHTCGCALKPWNNLAAPLFRPSIKTSGVPDCFEVLAEHMRACGQAFDGYDEEEKVAAVSRSKWLAWLCEPGFC